VLLHLSIGSVANRVFADLPCRKAILYHNITPAHYLEFINRQMATSLQAGREQLKALAGVAPVNLADSIYNARELEAEGYTGVNVLPLVLDLDKVTTRADRRVLRTFNDGKTNILFVGRCVPNKRLEDALRAFALYHRRVNAQSRFIHVGSFAGTERYYYYLLSMVKEIGANNVHFAGSVPQSMLNAFYNVSHVFLSMSEHEGFCIPLIESMACNLPVMAYAAAAIPETMDGAGVLFREKHFETVAEMMDELASATPLRAAVLTGQRHRIARYRARNLEQELRHRLAPLLWG
jgi:glycosyltransferase involved in cell wall biosynthesis